MNTLAAPVTDVVEQLKQAWTRSDSIFELLGEGAWNVRPIALRQPLVFYLGHLPAFAWNQLGRGLLDQPACRADFDELFEFGIDPLDATGVPTEPDWPDHGEILAYRDEIRRRLLDAVPAVDALADANELARERRIYHVVLEHELMHHETLLYMIAELDEGLKRAPQQTRVTPAGPVDTRETCEIPTGLTHIGAQFDDIPFGWDNEFPRRTVGVPAFRIDRYPVTNESYRLFVEAAGYHARSHWTRAGWTWREEQELAHPHHWRRHGSGWCVRGPFGELPFDTVARWPAQVSQAEASAYASWSGARLPTEAELNRAAYDTPSGSRRAYPWGDDAPTAEHGNFGFTHWEPTPVGSHPEGMSAWGVHELVGNGWEHSGTPFRPLPGFEPWISTYAGYSADFFDDKHFVVFGGSWATSVPLLRRSFRNWFQPHYPYVFSKFRCVHPDR